MIRSIKKSIINSPVRSAVGTGGGSSSEAFSSFKFDANADVVTVPVVAGNDLTGSQTWMVWFWVGAITEDLYFINKGGTAANSYRAPYFGHVANTGKLSGAMYPTIGSNSNSIAVQSTNSVNLNAWNFAALRVDTAANTLVIRLNGVNSQATYNFNVGSTLAGGYPWLLGQRASTVPDASMVRPMLAGRALSNAEIDSMSPAGNVPNYDTIPSAIRDDIVGAWECSGKDATGTDLAGISNGAVAASITVDGPDITYVDYSA